MENLRELHSFGPEASLLDTEQIDERTWLERFHDWKAQPVGGRFASSSATSFPGMRGLSARSARVRSSAHSRIVSEAEFAQIPILNPSQLVARWRQSVPATYISDANQPGRPETWLRAVSAGGDRRPLQSLHAADGGRDGIGHADHRRVTVIALCS